ncbi:hypothetical protein VP02_18925 [Pseudomonas ogarae]|uniref:TnsE C-terminal domain-containing protein n=1 Tax=Pseudomonas kilonensis TaxID=132476 RepID=A0A0F4XKI7_9PSED|nr:hypothetical protein VP02_18925 [Pseudomonas ogarae]
MHQRIKRIPPRENLCTTDDGEAIRHIRNGTVVVWWYERIKKNFEAQSIPYVDVIFRYLDPNDEPAGVTSAQIGVSRLGSFRLGTIWKDGKCIAETDLGEDQIFSVDFTEGAWSFLSLHGNQQPHSFFKKDYPLRTQPTGDVLSTLISFPVPEGNLLVPCVEFLYRCYGSTSDMARILTTYPWDEVVEKIYADSEKDSTTWLVQPSPDIPDDDALLLASMRYDAYAENAAKLIYAQLDNAHGRKLKETNLEVKPWFQGPARLRVRGRWINDHKTFLCFEVTGMSQPLDRSYEIRRDKYSRHDPEHASILTDIFKAKLELPKEQDPFAITDLQEPDQGSSRWSKPDPGFRVLEPKCPFTTSFVERSFSKRNVVPVEPNETQMRSTGDPQGYKKDVGKITAVAKRVLGDGGILQAMWEELTRLEKSNRSFSSLAWQSEQEGFVQNANFRLLSLPAFADTDAPKDKNRSWLVYTANATRRRGILVARMEINRRFFYLFELQRKKLRKQKVYAEEGISGLLMEISSDSEAALEISRICNEIRFANGNFRKLKTAIAAPHWIFRHHPSTSSTLYHAFEHMGVRLDFGSTAKLHST